jgi:hypothetical protein
VVRGSTHASDVQPKNRPITSAPADSHDNAAPVLLGRAEDRKWLADLLHRAREGHGGAVVLRGEAGIGKSALLQDLAGKAQECLICRVVGVESEMELPYAGLQQLCSPVTGRLVSCAGDSL